MTLSLLHGDNKSASRLALRKLVETHRAKGLEVITLDGRNIAYGELDAALGAQGLFAPHAVVIEGLLSRPRGKEKDLLISRVQRASERQPVILWEGKAVKTIPKSLSHAAVTRTQSSTSVYQFLDSFRPGNYQNARHLLTASSAEADAAFIFVLLARHLGNLLIAKSGDVSKLIPFQRGALNAQASHWGESELLALHRRLYNIDLALKSGQTKLGYAEHLDLLLTSLLN